MSSYYYHLVAVKPEHKKIFEDLFQTQDPAEYFNYRGGINHHTEWNEELYKKYEENSDHDNPIVPFVRDNTVDLQYFELWGTIDPFEYEWWQEMKKLFGKELIKIDKDLKDRIKYIMSYEDKKLTTGTYMMMEIYEFIIDNYGGYCYHYVY